MPPAALVQFVFNHNKHCHIRFLHVDQYTAYWPLLWNPLLLAGPAFAEVDVMEAPAAPAARSMRMEAVAEEAAAVELAAAREEDLLLVIPLLLRSTNHCTLDSSSWTATVLLQLVTCLLLVGRTQQSGLRTVWLPQLAVSVAALPTR